MRTVFRDHERARARCRSEVLGFLGIEGLASVHLQPDEVLKPESMKELFESRRDDPKGIVVRRELSACVVVQVGGGQNGVIPSLREVEEPRDALLRVRHEAQQPTTRGDRLPPVPMLSETASSW